MSWQKTHKTVTKDIESKKIWSIWSDVNLWHTWDTDIKFAKIEGPFQMGMSFFLQPKSGPQVKLELIKVQPDEGFIDMTRFPGARMYGIHKMRKTDEGLEVSHTVRVEGPLSFLWRKLVAEKVASGMEAQALKLIERARHVT